MAILGARMLEAQPAHVEAAETVRLRQAGEAATVQGIVNASEAALRRLMGWLVYWGGGDHDDATVELNRDVIDTNATPQEITAWTQALQSGAISFDTYYYLLKRSDMTRPDVDAETEKEQIENDGGEVAVAEGAAKQLMTTTPKLPRQSRVLDKFDLAFTPSTIRPAHYWGEIKRRAYAPPLIVSVKRWGKRINPNLSKASGFNALS